MSRSASGIRRLHASAAVVWILAASPLCLAQGDAPTTESPADPADAGPLPVISVPVAEEGPPLPVTEESHSQLEEIVVTARKRTESIQDVPLSVSAFSGDDLKQRGHNDLSAIADVSPNVEMEFTDPGHTFTYIRGVGTRRYDPGVDQSVATFVDGVYRGRSYSTNADLLAVERIEVLKGPQGTLYGKNTIAGAISVTTAAPRDLSWGGSFAYEPGMSSVPGDRFHHLSLVASGPLLDDRAGLALALSRRDRDGYQTVLDDDPPDGEPREDVRGGLENTWSGKAKLRIDLADAWALTVAGSTSRIDGPPVLFSPNDHGDPNAQIFSQNPATPRPPFTGDPRRMASAVPELFLKTDITDLSAHLHWDGDVVSMTSITGYEDSAYLESNDLDGVGLDVLTNAVDESANQLSQELRFDFDWETVRLLAGVYYSREEAQRFEKVRGGPDSYLSALNAGMPLNIDFTTGLETSGQAVFGQLNWDIATRLELTLGLRYSQDEKKVHLASVNDAVVPQVLLAGTLEEYDFLAERSWTSLDPLVSLSYEVVDDTMVYGTWSTGYKSGGFQWIALTESNARKLFDPETVSSFELGAKATLLDRRLRVNASVFQMAYEDLQLVRLDSSGAIVVAVSENAAASTIRGAELEGTLLLGEAFALDASYAYLDARYDDYLQDPSDPASQRAGNRLPRSPRNSFSSALTYTKYLGGGTLRARAGYSWKDAFFWEPDNNTPARDQAEPALGMWEASVGYAWGRYSVNLWGQNLSDEVYRVLVVDYGPTNATGQSNVNYDIFGAPRAFGLQLRIDFGDPA